MSPVDTGGAVRIALLTGAGGLVLALVGALVATSVDSATTGVAVRATLVTLLLVVAVRRSLAGRRAAALVPTAAVGLVVGHLLTLGWLNGQVYAARLLTDSVPLAAVLDLALWLVVGLAATGRLPVGPDRPQGYL